MPRNTCTSHENPCDYMNPGISSGPQQIPLQFKGQQKMLSSLGAVKRQEWKGKQFREYLILAELKPSFYWNIEKGHCWLKILSCMKQYTSNRREAVMYYPSIWGYDLPAIVIAAKVVLTEIETELWKILVLLFFFPLSMMLWLFFCCWDSPNV